METRLPKMVRIWAELSVWDETHGETVRPGTEAALHSTLKHLKFTRTLRVYEYTQGVTLTLSAH